MGMSASQARYLQLTARKSDTEYQAQQICHKRLTLAERTEKIASEYSEKINDRHLYFNAPYTRVNAVDKETGEARPLVQFGEDCTTLKRLDYYDITNEITDDTQPGLGYRLVNSDGRIVVPKLPENADPELYIVVPGIVANQETKETTYREACDYLENKLRSGEWSIQKPVLNNSENNILDWADVSIYSQQYIDDLLYKDNDSAAEAEYSQKTATIQQQDKMLEMRLTQLTTEQKAIDTELDSISKVLQKNIEGSFKTFA